MMKQWQLMCICFGICFSYITVSQGSVAMQLRCGGIFSFHVIANFQQHVPVSRTSKIGQLGEDKDKIKVGWYVFCLLKVPCHHQRCWWPCDARAPSSEILMCCVGLTLSVQHVLKLSRYCPFPLLPSTFPVTTKFSRPRHVMTCPRKLSCRWRIVVFISIRCTNMVLLDRSITILS